MCWHMGVRIRRTELVRSADENFARGITLNERGGRTVECKKTLVKFIRRSFDNQCIARRTSMKRNAGIAVPRYSVEPCLVGGLRNEAERLSGENAAQYENPAKVFGLAAAHRSVVSRRSGAPVCALRRSVSSA